MLAVGQGAGWGCQPARKQACGGVCPHSIEGGELFERIVDEDYQLTEVDTMVFVRQICDGILFMHKMRVLHLDLKVPGPWPPETRVATSPPAPLPSVLLSLPLPC